MNNINNNNNSRAGLFFFIKFIITIIFIGGILYIAFWVILIGAIARQDIVLFSGFALPLLTIPLFIVSLFSRRIRRRIKLSLWIIVLLLLVLPTTINWLYHLYDQSFTRLSESGVEVYHYKPFAPDTKAVYLDEPSSLKLSEPLPKLDGARALYPLYSAFAQAVYPQRTYNFDSEVGYHNTITAYERLINRSVDMIFVVSPSQTQLQQAQDQHVEIDFTAIGKDGFVFFVNANNPINNLTSQQLRDIYSGKITNWRQVGGRDQEIKAFQRNEGSGSQSAFLKFMQNVPVMPAPQNDVVGGMGRIIERTADYANYANAIGFSFRYFSQQMIANNEIKLLSIDGVYPSAETIATGSYPLSVEFYAATLVDNDDPDVARFLAWILSPQGQQLVEKTGYVPIIKSIN